MTKTSALDLYKKYFVEKSDERKMLFKELAGVFNPENGIYPGSFVHITPSFFIKNMTYIDSDKRVSAFFSDETVYRFIDQNKTYSENPSISWHRADYAAELPIETGNFDIMFSFYAGFISQSCKKYLKKHGNLVCNNSHGDASIAFADSDYTLIGAVKRNGNNFKIVDGNLDSYFRKKDGSPIDEKKVLRLMIGENFTKKEYAYIFRYRGDNKRHSGQEPTAISLEDA